MADAIGMPRNPNEVDFIGNWPLKGIRVDQQGEIAIRYQRITIFPVNPW